MKRFKKIFMLITILTLLIGFETPAGSQAVKEMVFGFNAPFSGPGAPWGVVKARSLENGMRIVNEAGGFTVEGQKYIWKLRKMDSAYVPSTAVGNARLLIQDGVKLINTLGTVCAAAVAPITEAAGILTLNNAGGGSKVTRPEYPLTFRWNFDFCLVHMGFYEWLSKNRKDIKTTAIINPDDETGWDSTNFARKAAEGVGIKVVAEEFYPRTLTDFYPVLTKIIAKKPDMIDFGVSPPGTTVLLTIATGELNYKRARVSFVPNVKLLKEKAGNHNEGAYMTATLAKPVTEAQKKAYNEYMRYFPPDEFDQVFYQDYDLIQILTKAITEANSLDARKIAETFRRMKFDVVYGPSGIAGKGTYGINSTVIIPAPIAQWEKGEPVYKGTAGAPPGY